MKSGIDTSTFKAHSTRSASTSQAGLQNASIVDILKRGSWSNKSTWQRFYKNVVEVQIFQEMVFKSAGDQVLILVPLRLIQPDLHQPLKQVYKMLQ